MRIWVTRHGQTDLNKQKLMQGRSDIPLNETGREQALSVSKKLGDVKFDAVYASPLDRAIETASIISGIDRDKIIVDSRIIEVDFGRFEKRSYHALGIVMSLYWALPEIFPCPKSVENIASMRQRTSSFLEEIESKDYENVLIVCHGGIIRAICGYLEDRRNGIKWRPKPKNCEVRVYKCEGGMHSIDTILYAPY